MIQRPIAYIAGLGVSIPERIVTNADFEKTLDTSDQWIVERTGIRERRFARPDETVSTMGKDAAVKALCRAGTTASELDGIIVATATPDSPLPSTACQIQALLGAERAATFDIADGLSKRGDRLQHPALGRHVDMIEGEVHQHRFPAADPAPQVNAVRPVIP